MSVTHGHINVLIVDDENKACTNLINILEEYIDADIQISGVANSTREAEALIKLIAPDALFLDIEMPNENAFQFLERIAPFNFEVIFVTAYDEYAVKAFKLNALDYILKPISIPELGSAVKKLQEKILYKRIVAQSAISYSELATQVANKTKQTKITLKDGITTEVVDFKNILYVEAQGSYSKIVFKKNDTIRDMIMSSPLLDYEDLLPSEYFFRIHRSYLINCIHVKKIINDDTNMVIIEQKFSLPISRRRYLPLIAFLKNNDYYHA